MSKVLIIDDDEELCELVSEYLGVEGFETAVVNDGASGLEAARSGKYDMAILDVMLPKMNGFEVLKNLRIDSSLPVLMLTARGDDMERIVGLETGADDYLPKPFTSAVNWSHGFARSCGRVNGMLPKRVRKRSRSRILNCLRRPGRRKPTVTR